jgi:hypothetical protein
MKKNKIEAQRWLHTADDDLDSASETVIEYRNMSMEMRHP